MKKVLFIATLFLSLVSCDNKTPQQRAQERINQMNAESLKKEQYVDSLVRVAYGNGDSKYMKQNRLNAIDLLEKEVPSTKPILDSLRNEIYQGNF